MNYNFIQHKRTCDDGANIIYYMESRGRAIGWIYWYSDSADIVYLDGMSVYEELRHHGVGTALQRMRETIALTNGARYARLTVLKDSWQHDWYIRRGYVDMEQEAVTPEYIWMQKELLKVVQS